MSFLGLENVEREVANEFRWAQTDTGNTAALAFGMEKADITIEVSVKGVVNAVCISLAPSLGSRAENNITD